VGFGEGTVRESRMEREEGVELKMSKRILEEGDGGDNFGAGDGVPVF
jgi:hypothetical protein